MLLNEGLVPVPGTRQLGNGGRAKRHQKGRGVPIYCRVFPCAETPGCFLDRVMCGDACAQDDGACQMVLRGLKDREHRRCATPDLEIGDIEPMSN
jgi:hypothetical protein